MKDNCSQNFIKAFQMVKSQLLQKQKIFVTRQVQEYINATPQYYALEDSVVASNADNLTTFQGFKINSTTKAPYVAEFIQKSCQEFLKIQSIEIYKDSRAQAIEMKQVAKYLYEQIEQSASKDKDLVKIVLKQMTNDLNVLEEIGTGILNLKNLTNIEITKLLSDFNPKKSQIFTAKLEYLNEEQISENFYRKLDQIWREKSDVPGQLIIISIMSGLIDKAISENKSQEEIVKQFLNAEEIFLAPLATFTRNHQDWVQKYIDCKMNMK